MPRQRARGALVFATIAKMKNDPFFKVTAVIILAGVIAALASPSPAKPEPLAAASAGAIGFVAKPATSSVFVQPAGPSHDARNIVGKS